MPRLILLNKPFDTICQFSASPPHATLADWVPVAGVYPAGRLDTDSEGMVLLTDHGPLQHAIAHPAAKAPKTYWVQVEGTPEAEQLEQLRQGMDLGDFVTQPASVRILPEPELWPRQPPVRFRKTVPTHWLEIIISEGKNRQVRRMTAKVGLPTLRLVRVAVGSLKLGELQPGEWREIAKGELPAVWQQAWSQTAAPKPHRAPQSSRAPRFKSTGAGRTARQRPK